MREGEVDGMAQKSPPFGCGKVQSPTIVKGSAEGQEEDRSTKGDELPEREPASGKHSVKCGTASSKKQLAEQVKSGCRCAMTTTETVGRLNLLRDNNGPEGVETAVSSKL